MCLKVFCTSWHPGGMNAIVPVIRKLMVDDKVEVVVMGHEFSEPILKQAGISYKTIKDYGLVDISLASVEKILEQEKPDIVFIGTASQEEKPIDILEHTLTLAARKMSITTLAVLDFWMNYWQRFTDVRTGEKLALLPDFVAVMDQVALQDMLKQDFPKEKIVVTGNPHFDSLTQRVASFTSQERSEVLAKVGLSVETLFFFAGTAFSDAKAVTGYWDLDVLEIIAKALKELPSVGLAVRLHPRMPAGDVQQISDFIAQSGLNIKIVLGVTSQDLVLASDLTISSNSTLLVEAVLMGKPALSLQPGLIGDDQLIVSRNKVIPVAYDTDRAYELVLQAADSGNRQELVKMASSFTTDGKATDRVVELVYSLLKP